MIEVVGEASLRDGSILQVSKYVPPLDPGEKMDVQRLQNFLRTHVVPGWMREREVTSMLEERMKGKDVDRLRKCYFIGTVKDEITTFVDYLTPEDTRDVGRLGPIYTSPLRRSQGAASSTLTLALSAFQKEGGMFLCAEPENEVEERVLQKVGFGTLSQDSSGLLWYATHGKSLPGELVSYFRRRGACTIRPIHIGDGLREPLLDLACTNWMKVMGFGALMDLVEEQAASRVLRDETGPFAEVLTGIVNAKDRLVGWSCLARHEVVDPLLTPHVMWLDFHVHPDYVDMTEEMLEVTLREGHARGGRRAYAIIPVEEEEKVGCASAVGFEEVCVLKKHLRVKNRYVDVALMEKEMVGER